MSDQTPAYVPVIERTDFNAVRALMDSDFRRKFQHYSDWLIQQQRWENFEAHSQAVHVLVNSKQFAAWIERDGIEPGIKDLIDFAASIGEMASA